MNRALVDRLVEAVLYEGYILYPYRPSLKNRQRWTFGGLYPRAFSERQTGADRWFLQAECLLDAPGDARLTVAARFLHLVDRRVGRPEPRGKLTWVESLEVDGEPHVAWQEAVEREVTLDDLQPATLSSQTRTTAFHFPAGETRQVLQTRSGTVAGVLVRQQESLTGDTSVTCQPIAPRGWKLTVRVRNVSTWQPSAAVSRDAALLRSLVSTHVVLNVQGGQFLSLTDPPAAWRAAAEDCQNLGCWPVLVGEPGACDTLLASPIILGDYPQVAQESPGTFFDSTEIDELLALRVLTLTDQEKRSMAALDPHAAAILARTEAGAREASRELHGAVRGLRSAEDGP